MQATDCAVCEVGTSVHEDPYTGFTSCFACREAVSAELFEASGAWTRSEPGDVELGEAIGRATASPPPRRVVASLRLLASGVTARMVTLAAVTSLVAGGIGRLRAWPLWAIVLVMLLPAVPVFAAPARQLRRHGALVFFYVLVVAQSGHVLEHVSQMAQLHVLHREGSEAHGVFGSLDVEWVHFGWNTAVLLAVVVLFRHYRGNAWLWLALLLAGWHQIEHSYILAVYLQTGQMGTPGLLAAGGAWGGGLPLRRPDLHFLYNVLETTPLVLGFLHQLERLCGSRRAAP